MQQSEQFFSNKQLKRMIIPLFIEQTRHLVIWLVLIHNIANAVVFPFADPLGKGLRATGDVRFTMGISLFTTIGVRFVLSVLLGIWCNLGVIGIALAMCLDWLVRAIIFWIRYKKAPGKSFRLSKASKRYFHASCRQQEHAF